MTWPGGEQGYGGNAGHGRQGHGGWQQPSPSDGNGWQQHYQPTPYGGLGVYATPGGHPDPGGKRPKKTKTLAILLSFVAVLVLGGAGTTIWLYLDRSKQQAAASSSSATATASTSSRSAPSQSASGTAQPSPTPKIAGWQAVSTQRGLTYDVPSNWKVLTPDTIIGFEDPQGKPLVFMKGAADYKEGYCTAHKGNSLSGSGVTGSNERDLAKSAAGAAQSWASAAYMTDDGKQPTVTLSQPEPVTVSGVQAMHVTANVKLTPKTDCDPPSGVVHIVALPSSDGQGSVLFISYANREVPNVSTDQDLAQTISSLRVSR
jgi:hypothetical protein